MQKSINTTGEAEQNRQNVRLSIARDKLVVITGISGSGKSSLVFDTICAEGRRKYVKSLSVTSRLSLNQLRSARKTKYTRRSRDYSKGR